jgi:hypothetical protein
LKRNIVPKDLIVLRKERHDRLTGKGEGINDRTKDEALALHIFVEKRLAVTGLKNKPSRNWF